MSDEKYFIGGINTTNQSGGSNVQNINFGPRKRDLNHPSFKGLKDQIIKDIPKDKPISVTAVMGSQEAYEFAAQIYAYLKDAGYEMAEGGIATVITMPPPSPLEFDEKRRQFTVGAIQ